LDTFSDYLGSDADRRGRLFAVLSDSSSPANARFVMRYNDTYPDHVSITLNPNSTYDAVYLVAYAALSLRDDAVTGPALGRAMGRLVPPGRPTEVGPTQLLDGLRELFAGRPIDLEGATSELDFDPSTGEVPADFALVCAAVGPTGRATGDEVESGVVFRARSGTVSGTPRCP
jgi:hypothetical protein